MYSKSLSFVIFFLHRCHEQLTTIHFSALFFFMKQVISNLNASILVRTAVLKLTGQHNSLYGPAACQVDYRNSFTYMSSGVQ